MKFSFKADFTATAKQKLLDKLNGAEQSVPFLVQLMPAERQSGSNLGDKRLAFVEKALTYARQKPQLGAGFMPLTDFERDLQIFFDLREALQIAVPFVEMLSDTSFVAGTQAYQRALAFYELVKTGAKNGVPGADAIATDLGELFKAANRNGSSDEEVPEEELDQPSFDDPETET